MLGIQCKGKLTIFRALILNSLQEKITLCTAVFHLKWLNGNTKNLKYASFAIADPI